MTETQTTEWQPIETAPQLKFNDPPIIFASFPRKLYFIGTRINTDFFTMMSGDYYAPTHWMPLPQPPVQD